MADLLVYAHEDGKDYVIVDDDGQAWRWPAVQGGWHARQPCPQSTLDACDELPAALARLALLLSGAPGPDEAEVTGR
jgi:hypothetical protein